MNAYRYRSIRLSATKKSSEMAVAVNGLQRCERLTAADHFVIIFDLTNSLYQAR